MSLTLAALYTLYNLYFVKHIKNLTVVITFNKTRNKTCKKTQ